MVRLQWLILPVIFLLMLIYLMRPKLRLATSVGLWLTIVCSLAVVIGCGQTRTFSSSADISSPTAAEADAVIADMDMADFEGMEPPMDPSEQAFFAARAGEVDKLDAHGPGWDKKNRTSFISNASEILCPSDH